MGGENVVFRIRWFSDLMFISKISRFWLITVLICSCMIELISGYRTETGIGIGNRQGCVWSNSGTSPIIRNSNINTATPGVSTLDCSLRTLNSEFWNYTFTREQRSATRIVRIKCSDKFLFESFLTPNQSLFQLENLQFLSIESCKIRKIPASASTLNPNSIGSSRIWSSSLQSLVLRSYNGDWSSSIGLEIESGGLDGFRSLETLDLSFNNIWVVPETRFLCSLPILRHLNLSHNHLSEVSQELSTFIDAECESPNSVLEILDLSFNTIRRIGPSGFSRLNKLSALHLQNNYIEELDDSAFAALPELRMLNLSENRLVALPPHLFKSNLNLIQLLLRNNSLSALSQEVFLGLDHLQLLDLSLNTLSSVWIKENVFKDLRALISLRLSFNQLSYLDPTIFTDLISLQSLNLDNNRIENISPEALSTLTNLQFLDLSRNRISVIDSRVLSSFCFVLRQLYLDHNRIRRMDEDSLRNCTNLQDFGLAGNILPEVPAAIRSANLNLLRTLDMGENRLVEVNNESFLGLGSLYGLRLVDNRISGLPMGFCDPLVKLRVLNLAQNRISHISPETFKGCPELRALRLDTNSLEEIPPSLPSQLPALLWLNISENRLKNADLRNLPETLEWLDLSYNSLESLEKSGESDSDNARNTILLRTRNSGSGGRRNLIPPTIQKFHLKVLDLSHNRLSQLGPNVLPSSLETLRVNHNELKKVAVDTFLGVPRLRRIELVGNRFENLSLSALRISLTAVALDRPLPQIFLSGNPFLCDCSMEWLTRVNQMSIGTLRQYPRIMDYETLQCRKGISGSSNSDMLLVDLKESKPSDFLCGYKSHCFPSCHCCEFDACDCEMTCPENCSCTRDSTWQTNIVECSNLNLSAIPGRIPMDATRIHLDGNDIPSLPSHSFIGKKNLKILSLNGSRLEFVKNKTFNGLRSLETLRLQHNSLTQLQGYEFTDLENLKELYLDNNQLGWIATGTFDKLNFLQILTLHGNFLGEFNVWELPGFLRSVTLSANPWSCECEFIIKFRTWIHSSSSSSAVVVPDYALANCQITKQTLNPKDQDQYPDFISVGTNENENENENENSRIISIPISSACNGNGNKDRNPLNTVLQNNHISPMGGSTHLQDKLSAAAVSKDDDFDSGYPAEKMNVNVNLKSPNLDSSDSEENSNGAIFWTILVTSVGLLIMILCAVILLLFRREIKIRRHGTNRNWKVFPMFPNLCCNSAGGKKSRNGGNSGIPRESRVSAELSDNDKLFDAYFVYSRRDEEMLSQKLVPELEHRNGHGLGHVQGNCGSGLRLCLHYRDLFLTPNSENPWNPDMVTSACDASKRVIILLSRTFLQSEWTNEDFRGAIAAALGSRQMCKKLILILLPPLSPTSLLNSAYAYPELRLALSSASSVLNWTDDNFWAKFKLLLPSPSLPIHVNSISRNCHYCETIPEIRNSEDRSCSSYTNLRFGGTNPNFPNNSSPLLKSGHHNSWQYHPTPIRIPQPAPQQRFVSLMPALPPIQFNTGTVLGSSGHSHSHAPNYHRQDNSLSTISNTYRPLTEQNFSDSTNTIGSSSNEELDHIYSTLDSPLQSPATLGLNLGSPKIIHQSAQSGSSGSSSGIGSGHLTSPASESGPIIATTITAGNNGQMYFV